MKKYLLLFGLLFLATPVFAETKVFNNVNCGTGFGCQVVQGDFYINSIHYSVGAVTGIYATIPRVYCAHPTRGDQTIFPYHQVVNDDSTLNVTNFVQDITDVEIACEGDLWLEGEIDGQLALIVDYSEMPARSAFVGSTTFGIATLIFLGSFVALGLGFNTFLSRRRSAHAYG